MNRKGFTLVELLAVIVILAVVMLIGFTAVGPMMTRSRKSALGTEGLSLIAAAKQAYQSEQMSANSAIKSTSSVCMSLSWLKSKGYYEKDDSNYKGSVFIRYDNGSYRYYFLISNGTYYYNGITTESYNNKGYDLAKDVTNENLDILNYCGYDDAQRNMTDELYAEITAAFADSRTAFCDSAIPGGCSLLSDLA